MNRWGKGAPEDDGRLGMPTGLRSAARIEQDAEEIPQGPAKVRRAPWLQERVRTPVLACAVAPGYLGADCGKPSAASDS